MGYGSVTPCILVETIYTGEQQIILAMIVDSFSSYIYVDTESVEVGHFIVHSPALMVPPFPFGFFLQEVLL